MNRNQRYVAHEITENINGLTDNLNHALDCLEEAHFQASNLDNTPEARALFNQIEVLMNMRDTLRQNAQAASRMSEQANAFEARLIIG